MFSCEREEHHHHNDHDDDHEHEYHSVTYWGDNFEILLSFEAHSTRIEGTAYVSDGHNQPVTSESLLLQLMDSGDGEQDSAEFEMTDEGTYPFELHHDGSDDFYITGDLTTDEIAKDFRTEHFHLDHSPAHSGTRFSKERQWLVEIDSGESRYRPVYKSFRAPGKARVDRNYAINVSSPVAGVLSSGIAVESGQMVSRGEPLISLDPSLNITGTFLERRNEYQQAREEMERAERLREDGSISSREYEMRRRAYEAQQYVFDHYIQQDEPGLQAPLSLDSNTVELRSPIDGVVSSIETSSGASVDEGQHLVTIKNIDHLWLDVQAYPDEIEDMGELRGVSFKAGNSSKRHHLDRGSIQQVTRASSSSDGIRQTLHLKPEAGAADLIPNRQFSARIYHSDAEEVLAVPSSAVFDQDAYNVVFVQTQGDHFEKRIVETGSSYEGWTEIRDGLEEHERVVTEGVYTVYLEAGSVEISDSHDH